jgi:hypothetical protein
VKRHVCSCCICFELWAPGGVELRRAQRVSSRKACQLGSVGEASWKEHSALSLAANDEQQQQQKQNLASHVCVVVL